MKLTNTERLILSFESAERAGFDYINFRVGKYTGNGPSVVAALKRRGFKLMRLNTGYYSMRRDAK
jgi:4-hydroxyphenylpyruvate dioxygenase-like putative hemolysin